MPYLKLQSNKTPESIDQLLLKASQLVAKVLNKPEKYVMVTFEENPNMLFGASNLHLFYCELKSIGLPADKTKELSKQLMDFLSIETGVASDRIYIEFANAGRNMWGWNSTTFEK